MATTTANLGLTKPAYADTADIEVINGNMDILDGAVNSVEGGIAIISNNNTHAAVAKGQYVYVRGHSTLAEGLYKAKSNISANATLSMSNLDAVGSGLGGEVASANANIDSINSNISARFGYFSHNFLGAIPGGKSGTVTVDGDSVFFLIAMTQRTANGSSAWLAGVYASGNNSFAKQICDAGQYVTLATSGSQLIITNSMESIPTNVFVLNLTNANRTYTLTVSP